MYTNTVCMAQYVLAIDMNKCKDAILNYNCVRLPVEYTVVCNDFINQHYYCGKLGVANI